VAPGDYDGLFLVSFLAWVWWAYTPRHKAMMEEAALLPFMDGEET
jgi:cbb3-type cytochrome oxidase subunit 3